MIRVVLASGKTVYANRGDYAVWAWNEGKWNNMAVFHEIGKAREFADSLEFNEVQIVKLT